MLCLAKGETKEFSRFISLLLPYYLDECFRYLLERIGFSVIHSNEKDLVEEAIRSVPIDIALEWQHSREDYPIRDLLRKYNRRVPMMNIHIARRTISKYREMMKILSFWNY